jgi:hypothetical protein
MQSSGYVKDLGAVRDEVNKPFEKWIAKLDPSLLSNEQAARDRFSLRHNLKALKRQAEIDLDNQRFWAEESRKRGDAMGSFRVLAAYHQTQYLLRQETIKLTEAALTKLAS